MPKKKHKNRTKRVDSNHTPLDKLAQQGKLLRSPLMTLPGGTKFMSWANDYMPNILWACILITNMDRKDALKLFRSVTVSARESLPEADYKNTHITHNFLSLLTLDQFDIFFNRVLADPVASDLLSALLLIDCLPDRAHWDRVLKTPEPGRHYNVLATAVMGCFDHQSQAATDVRWIKMMHQLCCGKIHFPESMAHKIEEFRLYPDKGDMRSVRPGIRNGEMMTRFIETGHSEPGNEPLPYVLPPSHCQQFWDEMLKKTGCDVIEKMNLPHAPVATITQELFSIYEAISHHFDATISHTGIDAKHDAAFGLVLYALTLALNMAMGYGHVLVEGRIVLRTIMESFVTLHYLKHHNSATLWERYRSDGSGKTKLAFLKNCEADELPDFIDLPRLQNLANEDLWLEFQDIELGQWAKSDLRTMATKCGVKDVYDRYYDWSSGYSHSQWVCVRDTVFTMCANPLHRFHRIPVPPKMNLPSVIPDACKLINRMLDDLNALYPAFKRRLREYTKESVQPATKIHPTGAT